MKCSDIDINEEWLSFLDFRDFDAYKKDVVDFTPDYLFHLGAYTDLEYCEENEAEMKVTMVCFDQETYQVMSELIET